MLILVLVLVLYHGQHVKTQFAIFRTNGQAFSVRVKRQRGERRARDYRALVQQTTFLNVPQFKGSIFGSSGKLSGTMWIEGQASDGRTMPLQLHHAFVGVGINDVDQTVRGHSHQCTTGIERTNTACARTVQKRVFVAV